MSSPSLKTPADEFQIDGNTLTLEEARQLLEQDETK